MTRAAWIVNCGWLLAIGWLYLSGQARAQADAGGLDVDAVVSLLELVLDPDSGSVDSAKQCLGVLSAKIQSRELAGKELAALQPRLDELLAGALAGKGDHPLYFDAALLASSWKNPAALAATGKVLRSPAEKDERRLAALNALIAAGDASLLDVVATILGDRAANSAAFRGTILQALGRLDDAKVAAAVLASYGKLEAELQPKAIELLTQRAAWAKALLAATGDGRIPAAAINANQIRKLLASGDAELVAAVKAKWGSIREDRDPKRDLVIAEMRRLIRITPPGDPHRGQAVFQRVCGQCHKLHGEGADVGPDITSNGRASFEQLLSNVFDPSLVIGAAYQAAIVRTVDGRSVTGLPVEDSDERIVLKVQGGKTETIARDDIDEMQTSKLSMMPEGLETQIKPDEMRDLFAFITLDRPPSDSSARQLPGVREPLPRETTDPGQFASIVGEVAPGFTLAASGGGGVALLAEHRGRKGVLRTHPVGKNAPAILRREIEVPAGKRTTLVIEAGHHQQGDWRLVIRVDGKTLRILEIGPKASTDGWQSVTVDLTSLSGRTAVVELENTATNWENEFAYWRQVEITTK